MAKKLRHGNKRAIPGWSEFVEEKHTLLGDIYSLWALVGKPRQGYIYSQLCLARSQFKYALRFCLKHETDPRAKALADKFASNPQNKAIFWKEVRKLNSGPPLAQSVSGVSGEANIAAMWKDYYSDVLNSVNNDNLKESVLSQLGNSRVGVNLSVREVLESTIELSSGRSPGCDELNAEHFKFAGVPCATHLSLCFSMMLTHNVLPSSFSKVILTPIVKDKTGNVFDKDIKHRNIWFSADTDSELKEDDDDNGWNITLVLAWYIAPTFPKNAPGHGPPRSHMCPRGAKLQTR